MIIDGDGQHRPDDARRLVSRLGEYDLVVGARSPETQANHGRRLGNSLLNGLASYLTGRDIPDLTSGFRAARRECLREFLHLLPNGFSAPTTTTLAFIKAGYNVAFEPTEARPRVGKSKIRLARDGAKFLVIILKIVTLFSPLRIFLPISLASFVLGAGYGLWTVGHAVEDPERRRAADSVRRRGVPRGPRVRTDFRAALRRPAVDGRVRGRAAADPGGGRGRPDRAARVRAAVLGSQAADARRARVPRAGAKRRGRPRVRLRRVARHGHRAAVRAGARCIRCSWRSSAPDPASTTPRRCA